MRRLSGLLAAVWLMVPLASDGATYHVDQGHAQTSDSNPGTSALPWKTIQKAADSVVAGDVVVVMAGSYDERIRFSPGHSGTSGGKITFQASPALSVSMRGFNTTNAAYLRIEGFDITNSTPGWQWSGVWVSSDGVEIVGNYFHDIPYSAIQTNWSRWSNDVLVSDNRIYHCNAGIIAAGSRWLLEGNEIDRLYDYGNYDADYSRFFGSSITFRNNNFHGTLMSEIGTSHTDCFQTFDNNEEYAQDILFEGNICSGYHQALMAEAGFHHNSRNFTFRNNLFMHSWSWGLAIGEIQNVVVVNNTFVDMANHGIGFNGGSTGVVENNIFHNAGSNYWAAAGSTITLAGRNLINPTGYPYFSVASDILNQDPAFVNVSGDDFRLTAGSPAKDAGLTLSGFNYDKGGTIRPQGSGWDIGAYEFRASGMPPAAPRNFRFSGQ